MSNFSVSGQVVDVLKKEIFPGTVVVENGKIKSITKTDSAPNHFILPGFVDAHVHVESSMLIPSEFARLAVPHGTVATISDPHEIGNVLGIDGVKYMINNGKKVPFKFAFGAPSCVPATVFETAGARIDVDGIDELLQMDEIVYLAEMMNFPGVLFKDPEVMAKIALAKKYNKPVDGHAPGLRGEDAKKYISEGIYTDHECFTKEEALDKLKYGMKILIREGSAAKNYNALISLLDEQPDMIMFCSDDKHPNELAVGHLNQIAARSVAYGADLWNILRALTYNVVSHYNLNVGLLQTGDPADFIIAEDLKDFKIKATYIDGELVAENGKSLIKSVSEESPNNFNCEPITVKQLVLKPEGKTIRVIEALDGQLITNEIHATAKTADGNVISDVENDILKMVVYNRYNPAPPAIAFVKNIGLKEGALASSVAHDSHNIVAVGTNDEDLAKAINLLVKAKGGVSIANGTEEGVLALPVAGIMTTEDGYKTADAYEALDKRTKEMGATLTAPYMTLSFLALLVIPDLKLSDKGLFSGNKFEFTSNFVD